MVAIYYTQTRQVTEDSHERFVGHIVVACQQLEKILCDDSVRVLGASIVAPPTADTVESAAPAINKQSTSRFMEYGVDEDVSDI